MNIVIVGLGLIGGSIAKSLSYSGKHRILGGDKDAEVLLDAQSMGAVTGIAADRDLMEADVIYLCLYPEAAVNWLGSKAKYIGKSTVVTDVCGIKTAISARLRAIAVENGFCYIGCHPMAGKEQSGFAASDGGLFRGASYIIASREECAEKRRLTALAEEMGFGRITCVSPEEHDSIIAFTSQLPHALACAYVQSPNCLRHKGFSAGSYRDVSRVAKINAPLWAELFIENREPLISEIDTLVENLKNLRSAIAAEDEPGLRGFLQKAREIKENFD